MAAARHSRHLPLAVLLCLILLFIAFQAVFTRFPHIDEVGYKGVGLELATHGRYALPEYKGFPIEPPFEKVYGLQAVYGLLTATVIALFGFGPVSLTLQDAVIHGVLSALTYAVGRRLHPGRSPWTAAAAGAAILPLGTLGRADELAMVFALGGLAVLVAGSFRSSALILAGMLFGLAATTQPQCAVIAGLIVMALLLSRWSGSMAPEDEGEAASTARWRGRPWRSLVLFGGVTVVVAVLVCAPFEIRNPGGLEQVLSLGPAYIEPFSLSALAQSWRYDKPGVILILPLALCALLDRRSRQTNLRRWCALWLGPLATLALLVTILPNRHYYLWFLGPWMLAATAGRAFGDGMESRIPWRAVVFAVCVAIGSTKATRQAIILLSLPQSQSLPHNAPIVRDLVPPGSRVVSDEYWWILAGDRTVYSGNFATLTPEQVDYVVVTGNGSGRPGVPNWPRALEHFRDRFEMVYDNLNREPLTLLGLRVTNSGWGFGPAIFRRVD